MILTGHEKTIADWVGTKVGKPFNQPYTAFGVIAQDGTLTGGCVFNGFNGSSICLSIAGRGSLSREALRTIVNYVFGQLECTRLEVNTRRSNKRVKKHVPRLGLTFEGVARRYYGNEDGLRYSLTVDDLPSFRKRWKL